MLTVEVDAAAVKTRLRAGTIVCPACSGVLRPWGFARSRWLRTRTSSQRVRPRRGRCEGCGRSQVLLPVIALLRRADDVEVIGAALAARSAGHGAGRIAGSLGRARSTVRGWLSRFAERAQRLRWLFVQVLTGVDPDPVPPGPAGSPVADAVAVIVAAGTAISRRWASGVLVVSPWRACCAVTGGRLLSPDRAGDRGGLSINTSPPWPGQV